MPFCPNCRVEYREGFTTCADCGRDLSVSPAALASDPPISPSEPLALVYEAPDQIQTLNIRAALEAAGLPVVEQKGTSPLTYDGIDFSVRGYYSRLLTVASRVAEAQQIVSDLLSPQEKVSIQWPDFPATPETDLKPHRGRVVFALGILGLLFGSLGGGIVPVGLVLGIMAWLRANADLKQMAAGVMDDSGRTLTIAGRIFGVFGILVSAVEIWVAINHFLGR